jgi:hypothetical protein
MNTFPNRSNLMRASGDARSPKRILAIVIVACCVTLVSPAYAGGDFTLRGQTASAGGGYVQGEQFSAVTAIAQTETGLTATPLTDVPDGTFEFTGGLLVREAPPAAPDDAVFADSYETVVP